MNAAAHAWGRLFTFTLYETYRLLFQPSAACGYRLINDLYDFVLQIHTDILNRACTCMIDETAC